MTGSTTTGPQENVNPSSNLSETAQLVQFVNRIASNLSETAQFVKPYLDRITQTMRDMGLVEKANKLMAENVPSTDPQVIDFKISCRDAQNKIIETLRQEKGENPKGEAVVSNYFNKLTASIG